jgi:hypothetical protein
MRDAEATRARLLAAARGEFAAFGIAGSRVDRIAATGGSKPPPAAARHRIVAQIVRDMLGAETRPLTATTPES